MARALLVGCGCRGRALGARLLESGWQVRGTTRHESGLAAIDQSGIEAVLADPDRIATVTDRIEGVTLIFWLLGTAEGEAEAIASLHGDRLARLLEEIVDTPVRGIVYELAEGLAPDRAVGALELLTAARERWRIPFEVVDAPPGDHQSWIEGMVAAAGELTGA